MMIRIFKKFKNVITINRPLTPLEKIDAACILSNSSLSMFKRAHSKLEEANNLLKEANDEAQEKVNTLQRQISRATDEINMNKAVQNKLEDFIL
ncbi:hypothetical protein M5X17_27950 [Paenibacillus alvei]|uniref:hypothetical protein n=1 Tax=Paenibacillus alvei TaxID=44250 RepID=UPI00227FFCA1|nr:hypothetical protein [Paenibacillus alvei]MCY9737541.1 hypothetical protein [Paenibacillus alvei]